MIGDPFLNYFALGLLFFVVAVLFYGIIAIHDIPHMIRNHVTILVRMQFTRSMGQPFYVACALAISFDFGDRLSAGARLGISHRAAPPAGPSEYRRIGTPAPAYHRTWQRVKKGDK